MRICFHVFSGTGNTLKVCKLLAERLEAHDHRTVIRQIRKDAVLSDECDILVIAYPVHAFNAPEPVIRFIRNLPILHSPLPVYLIQTSGEPLSLNRAATVLPERILRKRGYDVKGAFWYVMPYNIIFRHSDGMAVRMWNVVRKRADADASLISGLGRAPLSSGLVGKLVSTVLRIEHPGMYLIGRGFRADENCNGCGLCAKNCPQENIRIIDSHPVFGSDCSGCMNCSFHCPKNVISISILNNWKVNGEYDFSGESASDDSVCRYCRTSYLKYFHRYE